MAVVNNEISFNISVASGFESNKSHSLTHSHTHAHNRQYMDDKMFIQNLFISEMAFVVCCDGERSCARVFVVKIVHDN